VNLALGTVLAAALALTLGRPTPLNAHDTLLRSSPAKDASLGRVPAELRLTFSSAVTPRLSRIVLLGPDSTEITLDSLRRHADSASVLIAPVRGRLVAGRYSVVWQIAGADGHPVRGSYAFTILPEAVRDSIVEGDPDTGVVRSDTAADSHLGAHQDPALPARFDTSSPLFVIVRWLNFVGILGVIGVVGLEMLVLQRIGPASGATGTARSERGTTDMASSERGTTGTASSERGAASSSSGSASPAGDATALAGRRAANLGVALLSLTALSAILKLVAQTYALELDGGFAFGVMRDVLFASPWGVAWLVQLAAVLVAVVGLVLARRSATGWSLAALGAIGLAVSLSLSGHSAAAPRSPALTMVLDALHVVAAGGWLGTLLALVVVGLPATLTLPAERRGPAAAAMVNAFSPAALIFAGISLLTGLFAIGMHLGVPPAFLSTAYGRTLLVKLGAFVLVLALGAWNWRRVRPRLTEPGLPSHLRRTGTTELLVAALVVAATAVLVATPPPGH
jgi:putative copper export protein/methionine-rich copper-binding protein CopC